MIDGIVGEPGRDHVWVEAQQVAPLDIGDATLGDQTPDVSDADAEVTGDSCDVDQIGELC